MKNNNKSYSNKQYSATLLGCGKMGSSMLRLWLDKNILSKIDIIDPNPIGNEFSKDIRVNHIKGYDGENIKTDILILAVKPQIMKQATECIKSNISESCLVLSIAAGITIENLENIFGRKHPIIRSMPNTPAAIGQGVTAAIANKSTSTEQKECAANLLEGLGSFCWIEEERLMNAVTALSGSGPAYVFYLIEILSKVGADIGLDKETSTKLARQTVIGSAALAAKELDTTASILRENVTSPGGTTQAALNILMDGKMQDIFSTALQAAKIRSEELSS